jgi:hypothetical protein
MNWADDRRAQVPNLQARVRMLLVNGQHRKRARWRPQPSHGYNTS